jgi:hypothetical protein
LDTGNLYNICHVHFCTVLTGPSDHLLYIWAQRNFLLVCQIKKCFRPALQMLMIHGACVYSMSSVYFLQSEPFLRNMIKSYSILDNADGCCNHLFQKCQTEKAGGPRFWILYPHIYNTVTSSTLYNFQSLLFQLFLTHPPQFQHFAHIHLILSPLQLWKLLMSDLPTFEDGCLLGCCAV